MIKIIIAVLLCLFLWFSLFGDFKACLKAIIYAPLAVPYAVRDLINYFKNKEWKKFKESGIVMYGGLFGTGKTLNMVQYVEMLYRHYDNIEIISNVTFNNVPFTEFRYFEQLTDPTPPGKILVYVCDEFGSLFNSRNYQKNTITETEYLTVLNQLRKDHKLLLITTQRYGMLDKVFRQVAKSWYECGRFWRYYWRYEYDPYDLEYTNDPRLVKPVRIMPLMLFATNKVYNAYDTHEIVKNFDNPIEITGRSDSSSAVNADYRYSKKAYKRYYKR